MGRPKKVLTEAEKEAQKARWFGSERNERRRQKYLEDKDFREKEKARARVVSREPGPPSADNPLTNITRLSSFGTMREVVTPAGETRSMVCMTTQELAKVLFRTVHILYRWRQQGKWPKSVLVTKVEGGTGTDVYSVPEVKAMVRVIGEHLTKTPYFHNTHTDTAKALSEAAEAVRNKEGYYVNHADQAAAASIAAE